jgi:hypothetical protein
MERILVWWDVEVSRVRPSQPKRSAIPALAFVSVPVARTGPARLAR